MKILVVEDTEKHRCSAMDTLVGHELTIVESFDEAKKVLKRSTTDKEKVRRLLDEAGFPEHPGFKNQERLREYIEASSQAEKKSQIPFPFDVVLTDMMMPMDRETLVQDVFNPDEQVPYGFIIALRAALCGAKYVAMVTDTNHHFGAMSAALDWIECYDYTEVDSRNPNFVINGAKVMFTHAPLIKESLNAKNWGKVLECLTHS